MTIWDYMQGYLIVGCISSVGLLIKTMVEDDPDETLTIQDLVDCFFLGLIWPLFLFYVLSLKLFLWWQRRPRNWNKIKKQVVWRKRDKNDER